jgi:hypothetical protein
MRGEAEKACAGIFYALVAGGMGSKQVGRVVFVSFQGEEAKYGAFVVVLKRL